MKLKTLQRVQDALNDLSDKTLDNADVQEYVTCIEVFIDDIRQELEFEQAMDEVVQNIT